MHAFGDALTDEFVPALLAHQTTRPGLAFRHGPPPVVHADFTREATRPHDWPSTWVRSFHEANSRKGTLEAQTLQERRALISEREFAHRANGSHIDSRPRLPAPQKLVHAA